MLVNVSKSKVLNIKFGGVSLNLVPDFDNVSVLKILGVMFNDRLTWSHHFDYIIRKLSQRLYVLRILKPLFSHDKLVLVYKAIFLSVQIMLPLSFLIVASA